MTSHGYSAAALAIIVGLGSELKSYAATKRVLTKVGLAISAAHVRRLTDEIGGELAARRDLAVADYLHHRRVEPSVPAPAGAVVAVDGGRIQTRVATTGQGPGVHGEGWKEDKVACLYPIDGPTFAVDPQPEPPRSFLDAAHVDELAKAVHGQRGTNAAWPEMPLKPGGSDDRDVSARPQPASPARARAPRSWPPKRGPRTCLATMANSEAFGKMVAAEAYAQNFYRADRRAFLGDGQQYNWSIHKKWFADFEPIVDFIHVLSYLYAAATATSADATERWTLYERWMRACWLGRANDVVASIGEQAQRRGVGPPPADAADTDPRHVVHEATTYLTNNAPRMAYPRYRQMGLPVTSAAVESLIKEVNYRVKGTEKFWNHPKGAERILQVRAALLGDDNRLDMYLASRPGSPHRYTRRSEALESTVAA